MGESISAEPSASRPLVPTAESRVRPGDNIEPSPGGALQGEVAVLLHGLGPGALIMRRLARRVSQAGYETINWSYPSLRHTIKAHAQKLHELLRSLDARADVKRIHLVTYSMGSIITRYALGIGRPAKLGRIVMLAPPNRGSIWAALVGPALRPASASSISSRRVPAVLSMNCRNPTVWKLASSQHGRIYWSAARTPIFRRKRIILSSLVCIVRSSCNAMRRRPYCSSSPQDALPPHERYEVLRRTAQLRTLKFAR